MITDDCRPVPECAGVRFRRKSPARLGMPSSLAFRSSDPGSLAVTVQLAMIIGPARAHHVISDHQWRRGRALSGVGDDGPVVLA
eukprot:390605-Hanusia_phi.AAC.1